MEIPLSLVEEEPEFPQIREEQEEIPLSLVEEEPEFPQIKDEREEITFSLVQEETEPTQNKDEQEERISSLFQEEPGSIKEEHDELLQISEEETLLSFKHEDDDENMQTDHIANTLSQHMEIQVGVEDYGTSQPTSGDQLLSSHRSESDTEDCDERDDQAGSGLNTIMVAVNGLLQQMMKAEERFHETEERFNETFQRQDEKIGQLLSMIDSTVAAKNSTDSTLPPAKRIKRAHNSRLAVSEIISLHALCVHPRRECLHVLFCVLFLLIIFYSVIFLLSVFLASFIVYSVFSLFTVQHCICYYSLTNFVNHSVAGGGETFTQL